jgi:hypothetical protein
LEVARQVLAHSRELSPIPSRISLDVGKSDRNYRFSRERLKQARHVLAHSRELALDVGAPVKRNTLGATASWCRRRKPAAAAPISTASVLGSSICDLI